MAELVKAKSVRLDERIVKIQAQIDAAADEATDQPVNLSPWTKSSIANDIRQDRVVKSKMGSAKIIAQAAKESAANAAELAAARARAEMGYGDDEDDELEEAMALLDDAALDVADDDAGAENISPEHCTITGLETALRDGLRVKVPHEFVIHAKDHKGRAFGVGGGGFFAAIRGTARVRARVSDNGDGSYKVSWRPQTSGEYTISLSLFGVSLAGSPFKVVVHGAEPYAPNCEVKGDALFNIVSRQTANFEIRFRDRTNGIATPVALDVFVTPAATFVMPGEGGAGESTTISELAESPSAAEALALARPHRPALPWEVATGGQRMDLALEASPGGSKTGWEVLQTNGPTSGAAGGAKADAKSDGKGGVGERPADLKASLRGASRVMVGKKPLIVREEMALNSTQIAQLRPGQMLTVVEVVTDAATKTTRGRVTFVSESPQHTHSDDEEGSVAGASVDGGATEGSVFGGGSTVGMGSRLSFGDASIAGASVDGSIVASTAARRRVKFDPTAMATESRSVEHLTLRGNRRISRLGGGYKAVSDVEEQKRKRLLSEARLALHHAQAGGAGGYGLGGGGRGSGAFDDPNGSDYNGSVASRATSKGLMLSSNGEALQMGWVTLKKNGKLMVAGDWKLGPSERADYMAQWARRQLNDKLKFSVQSEVSCDPSKIGFAFGGVFPGVLHAKGNLSESHKVSYSVGRVGRYLLHVRLRQQAAELPGSPFALTVKPGPAHSSSTKLPPELQFTSPIRGHVGTGPNDGCSLLFWTHDQIGNACTEGGAKVENICRPAGKTSSVVTGGTQVDATVEDKGDGSYLLRWRGVSSGLFNAAIMIDKEPIGGSPVSIRLNSTIPELSKTMLEGDGLHSGVAGEASKVLISFIDSFGNPCRPNDQFKIGIAVMHELKKKVADTRPSAYEGRWLEDDSGTFELRFLPTTSGTSELHIWCDPFSKDERLSLQGSPFTIQISSGRPTALQSYVDGYMRESRNQEQQKKGKPQSKDEMNTAGDSDVVAGDAVSVRPILLDEYGNAANLGEADLASLTAKVVMPDGQAKSLDVLYDQVRRRYEARTDTMLSGAYQMHLMLDNNPIKNSPVVFETSPAHPMPTHSRLEPPATETCVASYDEPTTVVLHTHDRFGNKVLRGGLLVTGRLQLVKAAKKEPGEPNALLMPSNHSVVAEDRGDGTYLIRICTKLAATVRLYVQMDKNLGAAGELPPLLLNFVLPGTLAAAAAAPSPSAEPAPASADDPEPAAAAPTDDAS